MMNAFAKRLRSNPTRLRGPAAPTALAALLVLSGYGLAQQPGLNKYAMAGEAIASQFQWQEAAVVTAVAGGSGTISLPESSRTLPDGTSFEPFAAGVPVTVDDGPATETVVPTGSTCGVGMPAPCILTARFRFAHQGRLPVVSGTAGLMEAAQFAMANGGSVLLTPGRYLVGASVTLPNVTLRFRPGAILVVPPAATLTLNGPVEAGNHPIFSVAAPRTVHDASMAANSDLVTSPSAAFTQTDVGTKLYVGGASAIQHFGVYLPQVGTVVAVNSASTATASFTNASGGNLSGATLIAGGGYVVFGTDQTRRLNPVWWGADPTGTTDSTAAFDAAFTAGGDSGLPVAIPPGQYLVGHLQGGDPMQEGDYSLNEAQISDAAVIEGSGGTLQGGGGTGQTELIYDGTASSQYVLQRQNMQGVSWSGFSVNGNGRAPCLDAGWALQSGSGGPSAQDVFRDLTTENCVGTAVDLDNDNDSVIRNLRGISVSDLATAATGGVSAGTLTPLPVAATAGLRPDESIVVGSTTDSETVVVAAVGANSFTPVAPWSKSHIAGDPVVIPAIGLSLLAGTGEQSISDVRLAQGLLVFDVQNGAINGGFLAAGLETGFGGWDSVALNGPQIWPNPDLKAAILATGSAATPIQGVTCTGCMLTIPTGDAAIAGVWQQGATFRSSFFDLDSGGQVFGAVTPSAQTPPVFVFDHSEISGGTPNSPAGVDWIIHDGVAAGGPNGELYPSTYSEQGVTMATPFAGATPLVVTSAANATADIQDWTLNGSVVDSVDALGRLHFDANTGGIAPAVGSGGALSWNYSGGQGEVNFWDDFAAAQNTTTAFDWQILDAGGAPHQLAKLDRQGDLVATGTLAAQGLNLGGDGTLTAEAGTGTAVVTNVAPTIQNASLADATLSGTLSMPATYHVAAETLAQPATSGTLALTSQLPLAASTPAIGGAPLAAGACASGDVSLAGAAVGMAVVVTPAAYPGDGFYWEGYVGAPGAVTVKICAVVAATPASTTYAVRVLP